MINIKQIKIDVLESNKKEIEKAILKRLKTKKINSFEIIKESIDARDKNNIYYVYEVDVDVDNEKKYLNKGFELSPNREYNFKPKGTATIINKIVIVGAGPCGLFTAYNLCLHGYKPLIIERGKPVEERIEDIEKFWDHNDLNENSNVQFGEGGAGTFSDGKLNTLVKDPDNLGRFIFKTFVNCGAPKEIMYSNTPHIGTDKLREVIVNLRNKIISMGGEIRYNTCLNDLFIDQTNNRIRGIYVNDREYINTNCLILCLGHSARDTFIMLNKYLEMEAKPFALGVRIQHPQEMIDISQYGNKYYKKLPHANYKLTYHASNDRGVYSFCMCPGGWVVNSSSEYGMLCTNGMSYYKRDSGVANSAIIVTVTPDDFGNDPLSGMLFQRDLETKAYNLGLGSIPTQRLIDYRFNRDSEELTGFEPKIKGYYYLANLNKIFPDYINQALKEAIPSFGKKIKGFDMDDAILCGVEARTSSPLRILRNEYYSSNIDGIYPGGEGCGYAGGITSAAMDGIRLSEAVMDIYSTREIR